MITFIIIIIPVTIVSFLIGKYTERTHHDQYWDNH
jgi:hypothetical protein